MSKQNWKRGPLLVLAVVLGWNAVPVLAQTVEYIHTDALGTPIAVSNAVRTRVRCAGEAC